MIGALKTKKYGTFTTAEIHTVQKCYTATNQIKQRRLIVLARRDAFTHEFNQHRQQSLVPQNESNYLAGVS